MWTVPFLSPLGRLLSWKASPHSADREEKADFHILEEEDHIYYLESPVGEIPEIFLKQARNTLQHLLEGQWSLMHGLCRAGTTDPILASVQSMVPCWGLKACCRKGGWIQTPAIAEDDHIGFNNIFVLPLSASARNWCSSNHKYDEE